jgi:preprotein translocase subunit SecD
MLVYVERTPFLYEAHVASAGVVTNMGGYSLYIELNREGSWLLEQYTSANPQRRLAVRSQFGKDPVKDRWLGAPLPQTAIRNGILSFTPDTSWEETDQIARGIKAVVKAANK